MRPRPKYDDKRDRGSGKLEGKIAVISGGDSGIGRAVAVLFAREGADVAILYREERKDAEETKRLVEAEGRRCIASAGDLGDRAFCQRAVADVVKGFGRVDLLANNAAEQHMVEKFEDITPEQHQHFRIFVPGAGRAAAHGRGLDHHQHD